MIARRILEQSPPSTTHQAARDPKRACRRTIMLDGVRYRCAREVRTVDREHDGIHDAFVRHSDAGLVRW